MPSAQRRERRTERQENLVCRLYQQIGQSKVGLDGLKKNLDWTAERKRMAIERNHPVFSVSRQCELAGLPRSNLHYRPVSAKAPDEAHPCHCLNFALLTIPY
jgi:hypothetical protein